MREINRTIVAAIILSQDNKILLGKKDPSKGGVYPNCWHTPGGGVDEGETLEQAVIREVREEVGIDITPYPLERIPLVDQGVAEKTLKETGERVLCHMEFNRFQIVIKDQLAKDIQLQLNDDLVEAQWFSMEELAQTKQIPSGREFFQKLGFIPKD